MLIGSHRQGGKTNRKKDTVACPATCSGGDPNGPHRLVSGCLCGALSPHADLKGRPAEANVLQCGLSKCCTDMAAESVRQTANCGNCTLSNVIRPFFASAHRSYPTRLPPRDIPDLAPIPTAADPCLQFRGAVARFGGFRCSSRCSTSPAATYSKDFDIIFGFFF